MLTFKNHFKAQASLVFLALLVFFLSGCDLTSEKTAQPASSSAVAAGNVKAGERLFMGYAHFENGGPPCMGCHSLGDYGLLGGGALGPNLTDASERLSTEQLVSILANLGPTLSPVMAPIYGAHPLKVSEQANLIAFLQASAGQPEVSREPAVLGISLVGSVVAVILFGIIYRGRLRGVRRPLVEKTQKETL